MRVLGYAQQDSLASSRRKDISWKTLCDSQSYLGENQRTSKPENQVWRLFRDSQPLSQATSVRVSLGSDPAAHSHPCAESGQVTRVSVTAALRTSPLHPLRAVSALLSPLLLNQSLTQGHLVSGAQVTSQPCKRNWPIKFLASDVGCCGLTGGKIGSLGKVFKCEKQPKQQLISTRYGQGSWRHSFKGL